MKVLMCQINTTPGDFKGNYHKIFDGLKFARGQDVDVIVFPELAIPGYLCRDLMYENNFVHRNLFVLEEIVRDSSLNMRQYIVVGYIDANNTGKGKPFKNMLAVIRDGAIVGTYQKHLLPFYDVFDEGRYFEPGRDTLVLDIDGEKVGFAICEDLWANCKGETDLFNYETNPVTIYKNLGVNTIISINSSPYTKEKPEYRLEMLEDISEKNNLDIIYVNQVGGQDDLVFDGHSCVISVERGVIHLLKSVEGYELVSTKDCPLSGYYDIVTDRNKNLYNMLVTGIRDYVTKCGFKSVVLGSSGGIDSALVATLACKAIGAENVNCIMMPSCYSSEGSVKDAQQLHKNLGCKQFKVPIDHAEYVGGIKNSLGWDYHNPPEYNPVADENIQSRMRGNIIMYYANAMNSLAIGTSNKCESAVGYFTVFGDTANFFNPLIDLYKMEIYDLAKWINHIEGRAGIPQEIIDKAPSAELAPGQTDEKSLLPYPILDKIVEMYIEKYINTCDNFMKETLMEVKREDYDRIIRLIRINEFKRRMVAMGIKLTSKSFGSGRRYPVVAKY
jgi:NAD+ synthase (glutamine-hydrolysing)